jgi:hypothetical protein
MIQTNELTAQETDRNLTDNDLNAIAEVLTSRILSALESRNVLPQRYPERMSTRDVAVTVGCSEGSVRRNWRLWKLRMTGRGQHGQMNFTGLSVQRYIESLQIKKRGVK